jgi:hypothetical protein
MIGRQKELSILENDFTEKKSSLIVCYGRRRIGKSYLLNTYIEKHSHFQFEGIEAQSPKIQIQSFTKKILIQFKIKTIKANSIKTWEDALILLTQNIPKNKKYIILLDEFQWMTSGRSLLQALLKKFWDNDWKDKKIQLILCGSVSSYMIDKVIKSKALYGRINIELKLGFLPTNESIKFFNKNKSINEIFKYLLIFNGTPKYLADINNSLSFEQNIVEMFFNKNSGYHNELEKVFYSQFKEYKIYEKIVSFLSNGPQGLESISQSIKMKSGGGLKSYLSNLEKALFIKSYYSNPNNQKSKIITYKLTDPFLRFYFYFIHPNKKILDSELSPETLMNKITFKKLDIFLGFAFENYCLINVMDIASIIGIQSRITTYGPLTIKGKAQIDLVFFRDDQTISIIEIKYQNIEVPTKIILEMEKKIEILHSIYPQYSIHKILITQSLPSKKLILSEYFDKIITIKDLMNLNEKV